MKITLLSLAGLALISLLLVNILGKNIFLNISTGTDTIVIAASGGSLHLARTSEAIDAKTTPDELDIDVCFLSDVGYQELIQFGSFDLYAEDRLDPVNYFRIASTPGNESFDYSSIEFPLLLLPLAPFALLCLAISATKNKTGQVTAPEH
jgi:hypothetical protein